ncbi:ribonuclease Z, partial [bacterium]|nr:ribonuclease Z [bacterium]
AYEDDTIRLKWQPLEHSIFCLGYRMEELERPGKFDIIKAEKLEVPKGRFWSKLQAGQSVELADQRVITPEMVLGPCRRGRHLAFVVDTRPTQSALQLCQDVDLAFIEGMFAADYEAEAIEKKHMTVKEAGSLTRTANVLRSVLVHLSPRIANSELAGLEAEAQLENPNIEIGRRLARYSVLLPEKLPQSD